MGLLSRLKEATGLECVREPCVHPKDSPIMTENHQAPVGALESDGGRSMKSFWKWAALHFPSRRKGTYDLAKAEEKYGTEAETQWRDSDDPAPEDLLAAEEQQKHSVLDKNQSELCVHPKDGPITSESRHPHPSEIDGGREQEGREEKKKKKSFWKWPALHFPCCGAGTYDLAEVEEKYWIEAGTHWRDSDDQSVHEHCVQPKHSPTRSEEMPVSAVENDGGRTEAGREEVLLTTEEQLVQDILDKGHIRKQYKIGRMLGEGGCGSVYEGTRCEDGLKVAVKCSEKTPDMSYIRVPGHPKRLPMEIGLMLMANNGPSVSQIIKLLDWEDDTDHYVIVMERPVPCVDLFTFVDDEEMLDEGIARNIMRQIIDAAKTCCDRGVFHRDIKLENILVNQDTMEVKLIDFGCGAVMKKSAFKSFSGTKEYCPPEFNLKGRYKAKPTTVWTLGFILFEMLCGECPTSYDQHKITVNLWTRPGLSKECCQMICDCLQPDPQRRLSLDKMHLHDWFKVTE
ncbi:serine/threonine-protein kinase pim-2-like isoform X2 [Carassius carassius]|uniref:serine/threonine-protein kinase pim-2-like isoform X2 n=1 Tax=Carassius carassius TaxID=217509 RepID=UPI0028683BF6|nr:serine/threonine-protein kinase pim-2-like isoform X2 [Carassius carassius]